MTEIPDDFVRLRLLLVAVQYGALGSIRAGLDFVSGQLEDCCGRAASPMHTTEFNFLTDGRDHRKRPDGAVPASALRATRRPLSTPRGHTVGALDFDVGSGVLDRYVDVPPYFLDGGLMSTGAFDSVNQAAHLRMLLGGFPITCFAVIAERR